MIVYEPHAEQLFFVNTQRLRDLLSIEEPTPSTTSTEAPSVIYIALTGSQAQVCLSAVSHIANIRSNSTGD